MTSSIPQRAPGTTDLWGEDRILFAGVNQLFGSEADDILFAGKGGNTLTGGDGQDQF